MMPSDTPHTLNTHDVGTVLQAGAVHGGIHLYAKVDDRPIIPQQLPTSPRWFVARQRELERLTSTVRTCTSSNELGILVVEGVGGVGKTTLVLHWAHSSVDQFPDGQLYADLSGFAPFAAPVEPHTVLHHFLVAMGIDPPAVPADLDAAAALYRSVLAERRVLVVLDNARDVRQVLPLLPGMPSSVVVITARHHLAGLRMRGATFIRLDTLADVDARTLLLRQLPAETAIAEPAALTTVVQRCAGLPLALAIVAARTTDHPEFPISHLAHELQEEATGLSAFDAGDESANLRAVLSWSSSSLNEDEARAFRLLGTAPVTDIGITAAASVLAVPLAEATQLLRSLETKHLIRQHQPKRFQMHDLVRQHAGELAASCESFSDRIDALRRLACFYAHTARAADHLLYPHRFAVDPPRLPAGCQPQVLADEPAALAWFGEEHQQLLTVQRSAAREGWSELVWHIARALDTYQYRMSFLMDNIATSRLGVQAAEALGMPQLHASALRQLGRAHTRSNELSEARSCLEQALQLEIQTTNTLGQAHTHHDLQRALSFSGDHQRALRHAATAFNLYQAVHDPTGQAHALNAMGRQYAEVGQYERAREHCESALAMHRAHHNPSGQLATLDSLGYIAHRTADPVNALEWYTAALALAHELGNQFAKAEIVEHLAEVHHAHGDRDKALEYLRLAHELFARHHRMRDAERVGDRINHLQAQSPPE